LFSGFLKALAANATALALAACQSASAPTSTAAVSAYAPVGTALISAYAPEIPELSCSAHGNPGGKPAKLTANRTTSGNPAYIEFRQRFSPGLPSGHLFVVFGRLDQSGNPVTRQYIGLFPKGSLVGLYGGAIVPIPADLKPSYSDCHFPANAAYRVSLSEGQYQQLLGKVRASLASPPMWRMFGYNCNNYAASLGSVAGLVEPANRTQPSFSYIFAYIEANGDGARKPAS
jgi:hypothetical protein